MSSILPKQKAVSAYITSKQILPFYFCRAVKLKSHLFHMLFILFLDELLCIEIMISTEGLPEPNDPDRVGYSPPAQVVYAPVKSDDISDVLRTGMVCTVLHIILDVKQDLGIEDTIYNIPLHFTSHF